MEFTKYTHYYIPMNSQLAARITYFGTLGHATLLGLSITVEINLTEMTI